MITINMEKAREIHKETIRELRKPLFEKLDVEFIKAVESGDQSLIQEIVDLKRELRDATSYHLISSAETPEELKEAIPDILKVD